MAKFSAQICPEHQILDLGRGLLRVLGHRTREDRRTISGVYNVFFRSRDPEILEKNKTNFT